MAAAGHQSVFGPSPGSAPNQQTQTQDDSLALSGSSLESQIKSLMFRQSPRLTPFAASATSSTYCYPAGPPTINLRSKHARLGPEAAAARERYEQNATTADTLPVFHAKEDSGMIVMFDHPKLTMLLDKRPGDTNQCFGLGRLLESADFSDVELIVGADAIIIKAHCNILSMRSTFFAALLRSKMVESITRKIKLPECHYQTIRDILHYIYTGDIPHRHHPGFLARLYKEADFLGIPELMEWVKDHLHNAVIFHERNRRSTEPGIEKQLISSTWVVCMIRGLSESLSTPQQWMDTIGSTLSRLPAWPEFESWLQDKEFRSMLDENPIPARIFLVKSHGTCALLQRANLGQELDLVRIKSDRSRLSHELEALRHSKRQQDAQNEQQRERMIRDTVRLELECGRQKEELARVKLEKAQQWAELKAVNSQYARTREQYLELQGRITDKKYLNEIAALRKREEGKKKENEKAKEGDEEKDAESGNVSGPRWSFYMTRSKSQRQ
ncbi:hypothetical protein ABW21_db0202569 [Orbilia brochopaga]|nr:hypothetical protein ABW21_db0202569 [Drechslerella brochopaga]